jgi:two-component system cell cycle response regulator DivK
VVLVAEDDRDARRIYRTYLRAMGCRVYTARDGLTAVERAHTCCPDVIVMDLRMPRLDGWAATRLLKNDTATASIPIIVLSAAQLSRESARAAGCDAYLAKPCLLELLWWEIRALIDAAALRRADASSTSQPSG